MREVKSTKNQLLRFGLTEKQASVYVFLLRHGNARVNQLASSLNMPRSSVYETLKSLYEIGLAEEIIENSYRVIQPYPISSFRLRLDEQIIDIRKKISELEHLEKSLAVLPGIDEKPRTIIRYYKGKVGAQQLFWNSLRAKDEIKVYSEWGRANYVGVDFYKKFVAESKNRDIKERVITNSSKDILQIMSQHAGSPIARTDLSHIRGVPIDMIPFKGDTLMYNNIFAQIYLKDDEIDGFEIENKRFVTAQRAIYETVWQTAVPVLDLVKA